LSAGRLWPERLRFDLAATLVLCAALAIVPIFEQSPYTLGLLLVRV
jgi:hypothetical protein